MFKKKLNFKKLPVVLNKVRFYLYKGTKYKWNSINFPPKFKSEGEYTKNDFTVNNSTICFSSLNQQMGKNNKCDRMVFIFEKSKCITDDEMRRWLSLCKKNGLLPRYAGVTNIMKHKSLVLDVTKHTRNLIYTYLTVCRFPQEDPNMVRNTLTLVEDFKMDFFVALTFATQILMNNMGHHFLPGISPYMKPTNVDKLDETRVEHMIGLYRFIQKGGPQRESKTSFNANSSVGSMCKINLQLKAKHMLHPALPAIVRAKTDQEAEKLIKAAKFGG
jgi:hypothetical protein